MSPTAYIWERGKNLPRKSAAVASILTLTLAWGKFWRVRTHAHYTQTQKRPTVAPQIHAHSFSTAAMAKAHRCIAQHMCAYLPKKRRTCAAEQAYRNLIARATKVLFAGVAQVSQLRNHRRVDQTWCKKISEMSSSNWAIFYGPRKWGRFFSGLDWNLTNFNSYSKLELTQRCTSVNGAVDSIVVTSWNSFPKTRLDWVEVDEPTW